MSDVRCMMYDFGISDFEILEFQIATV